MGETLGMDGCDPVVLQVELPQALQRLKFVARQFRELIAVQVEDEEPLEAAEGVILQGCHGGAVEEEGPQILLPYEGVVGQLGEVVPVQIDIRGIHWDPGRDIREGLGRIAPASAGTVHDIGGPGLVVIAGAIGGTDHLAVAGIEIAAVTEGEAVGPVRTKEVRGRGLHQRRDGSGSTSVGEPAVDGILRRRTILSC